MESNEEYNLFNILALLRASVSCLMIVNESHQQFINHLEKAIERSNYNYNSLPKLTSKWSDIMSKIPDRLFRRMFRCNKETFTILSEKIKSKVGIAIFKPDDWLANQNKSYDNAVCGDIKLACIHENIHKVLKLRHHMS